MVIVGPGVGLGVGQDSGLGGGSSLCSAWTLWGWWRGVCGGGVVRPLAEGGGDGVGRSCQEGEEAAARAVGGASRSLVW